MGNPRGVHYAFQLAALVLASCSPPANRDDARAIARDEAAAAASPLRDRIGELETKNAELERRLAVAEINASAALDGNSDLVKVVNNNAKTANENAARDMTRRGACGTEQVWLPGGGFTIRNKECTTKDMR